MTRPVIFTLGHSTRSLDELVEILRAHGVERLVDVRTIPRSRHKSQGDLPVQHTRADIATAKLALAFATICLYHKYLN